jgi:hypothetical protein
VDDTSVNFIELIALTRITAESTVEKFGSLINSSFFDASNILAGLKMKGLVDFITAFPSQSTLKVTDKGTALIAEANAKATEPIDALDSAILAQLAGGRRNLTELGGALNVAQKDLAMHIFKLSAQQTLTYELVNATISMYLTEKGFVTAKGTAQADAAAAVAAAAANGQPQPSTNPKADEEILVLEMITKKRRLRTRLMIVGVVAIAVVAVVFLIMEKIIVL